MKLHITKEISEGSFIVSISVSDFTVEEINKMEKFGIPVINLAPANARYMNRIVTSLPINKIDNDFRFINEFLANTFADAMKNKIEAAMRKLKDLQDNFSSSKEYEIR